jgi:uncharacterized protein DUF5666
MIRTPFVRGLFLVIPAVFAMSCGDSSFSPTSPSRNGAAGQPGAIITGQVNSAFASGTSRAIAGMLATPEMSATAGAGAFATADTASVTVKVVGTNISTTTNGQGQFTLTGVPPGEVKLEFTGAGGSATISISGVRADEEIRISVTLNGTNARVDSERRNKRNDGRPDQPEVKGAVSGLTGTCPKVSFTVGGNGGTTVNTSESTRFEDVRCTSIKDGMRVEVTGARQSDGSITATKVEIDD